MSRFHTAGALALTASGALSLSLLGQAPSFATDPSGPAKPSVSVGTLSGYSYSYGGNCGSHEHSEQPSEAVTPNGGPATHSSSMKRTFTHPEDPEDVTQGTGTSTGTSSVSTRADGSLHKFQYDGSSSLDVTRPENSKCSSYIHSSTNSRVEFTLTEASFVTIRVTNDEGRGWTNGWIQSTEEDQYWGYTGTQGGGLRSHAVTTAFLPAGNYVASGQQSSGGYHHDTQQQNVSEESAGSVTMRVREAGTRLSTRNDEGRRFVALPQGRDCTTDQLAVNFKDNASRVRKAQFVVNGELAQSVKAPKAGQSVTLDGFDRGSKKSVVQVLVTRKPAHPGGTARTAYLQRTYAPCD